MFAIVRGDFHILIFRKMENFLANWHRMINHGKHIERVNEGKVIEGKVFQEQQSISGYRGSDQEARFCQGSEVRNGFMQKSWVDTVRGFSSSSDSESDQN